MGGLRCCQCSIESGLNVRHRSGAVACDIGGAAGGACDDQPRAITHSDPAAGAAAVNANRYGWDQCRHKAALAWDISGQNRKAQATPPCFGGARPEEAAPQNA